VKYHSLTSVEIKGIRLIFKVLLNFLSDSGYTETTLNYLYIFKLMYVYLGIDKNNKFTEVPKISNEKKSSSLIVLIQSKIMSMVSFPRS